MLLDLSNKKVLVGGGSRGIGAAIARQFLASGAEIAIAARNAAGLEAAAHALGEACTPYVADLTDPAECDHLVKALESKWGRLDVLITCAGSGASVPPGTETPAEWTRVVEINLFTATNLISAATPLLARAAPSSIVCISSICGMEFLGAPVTYSAAKAALLMAVKGLARPLAEQNIRINAISPGNIFFSGGTWDKKLQEAPEKVRAMLATQVPQHRLGTPEDIAQATVFLASPQAGFITGANLAVDGGQTRSL